jgi:hypothetical protein
LLRNTSAIVLNRQTTIALKHALRIPTVLSVLLGRAVAVTPKAVPALALLPEAGGFRLVQ